jgi:hypothetical protein
MPAGFIGLDAIVDSTFVADAEEIVNRRISRVLYLRRQRRYRYQDRQWQRGP